MTANFQEQVSVKADSELLNIFVNADEYQEAFVDAVEEELTRRNVNLEEFKKEKKEKALLKQEQYAKGRPGNQAYIVLAFISAALRGFLGIVAGYVYSQFKHQDDFGVKHYVYDAKTRELGRVMMVIGIFVLLATIIWSLSQ